MAHMICMLDKESYMHACACIRPRGRAHARTNLQYLLLFHGKNNWRKSLVYCLCCFILILFTTIPRVKTRIDLHLT